MQQKQQHKKQNNQLAMQRPQLCVNNIVMTAHQQKKVTMLIEKEVNECHTKLSTKHF